MFSKDQLRPVVLALLEEHLYLDLTQNSGTATVTVGLKDGDEKVEISSVTFSTGGTFQ